jgi:hypothetical protein
VRDEPRVADELGDATRGGREHHLERAAHLQQLSAVDDAEAVAEGLGLG